MLAQRDDAAAMVIPAALASTMNSRREIRFRRLAAVMRFRTLEISALDIVMVLP
ncbi:MAG: hypothetical protein OXL68_02530 [Paracoccaceae bacterium]|nr:hypothetical protein [Paracoccaceae bacterium]